VKRLGLFLGVLLLASLAFAAGPTKQTTRWAFLGGISIGNDDTDNRVTKTLGKSSTIDFTSVTTTCVDSSAITVTGARAGDPCFVGPPTTATANLSFTCYVSAADAVKVRACAAGTAADAASATYYVRVISSQ
jgi:hypothetical protein